MSLQCHSSTLGEVILVEPAREASGGFTTS
jgi:hypothetical protein